MNLILNIYTKASKSGNTNLVVYTELTKLPVHLDPSRFQFASSDCSIRNSRANKCYHLWNEICDLIVNTTPPLKTVLQVLFPNSSPLLPIIADKLVVSLKSLWLLSSPSSWKLFKWESSHEWTISRWILKSGWERNWYSRRNGCLEWHWVQRWHECH